MKRINSIVIEGILYTGLTLDETSRPVFSLDRNQINSTDISPFCDIFSTLFSPLDNLVVKTAASRCFHRIAFLV